MTSQDSHNPTLDELIDDSLCKLPDGFSYQDEDYVIAVNKLKALIADEVVKARIDELKKVQIDYVKYPARIWVDGKPQSIEERISELKKEE